MFYHERKVLIVAFGLSVTNKPTVSWNIPNLKTINQYFVERKIVQTKIEQKYNDSFVHSVFPVNVVNNKIDESRFNIDEVFNSLNSVCDTYKKRLENMNKNNGNVENTPNDLINFKHLLEYFCAHLQYVVTGNKSITGYEEYLKQYVDTNTFKKSGQGYKGDKIQLQIKPWEKYNYGNICIAVYGSSPQGYVTYLHWKGTGHNISANWSGNMISSLQLVEFMDYNGNKRWNPQPTKYTIDELGLFDKNEPNANVKEMFNAFVEMLKKNIIMDTNNQQINFSISSIVDIIKNTGLIYSDNLIKRFVFSLMNKPFVILSGLAGSGKTQLALAFANALVAEKEKQMCVVSVGADWTNREPLLGFPNALQQNQYVKPESKVLDLIIEANKVDNANKPYFLILDEMNMSYVERYFADFLSSMESHENIKLWDKDVESVPSSITLPPNLFIIGTINVDETTYMFSPKVLDRANVIEFKISEDEMDKFLDNLTKVDANAIVGKGSDMAADFVKLASNKEFEKDEKAAETLKEFFKELKAVNAEFGYRSATEIFRFICNANKNDEAAKDRKMTSEEILDAAIVQKLLPKLHGSRKKLEPVLQSLWKLCFKGQDKDLQNISEENAKKAVFKDSADKIRRMYESANANGFTSFAEA